ncbi:MAG: maleylpyruvate isomerase family mycothiol-dependent enzyme, partial [Dehalococcoidia bacterium]
ALHLLGGDDGILSRQRDGWTAGARTITGWEELVAFINDWNRAWVETTRRMSPRLLCELLRLTGAQVSAYFDTLDPEAVGGAVSWAEPEPAPVWLDLAREYTERWHHQQQIRDAVNHPGLTEPEFLAPVLDTFVRALPHTYGDIAAPDGAAVALSITGEAGGHWYVLHQGGRWQLHVGMPDVPAAAVTVDEDTAWRLFTKGIQPQDAAGKVTIGGDVALGRVALGMVSVIA